MKRKLSKSTKTALKEMSCKECAVKSMRLLTDSGVEDLSDRLKKTEAELEATRRAFFSLTDEQRDVLDRFFIHRSENSISELCRKYCCSQSTVYRMQREAVRAMTLSLYGRTE